jgi:hypothetical protein
MPLFVNCLSCNKVVHLDKGKPIKATVWKSRGNPSSTVYDSTDPNKFLIACICDECLVAKTAFLYERKMHKDPLTGELTGTFKDVIIKLVAPESIPELISVRIAAAEQRPEEPAFTL